jgi:alcohol dehydrogenase class IV
MPIFQESKDIIYQLPKKIVFGVDTYKKVGFEAKILGGRRILIVSDKNLVKIGVVKKIECTLASEDLVVNIFDRVEAEPRLETAEAVSEVVREDEFDVIIGVGGGSVLDMAKVASIASTNTEPIADYIGIDLVKEEGIPKILIPTTAGTGSEVTDIAIMSLKEEEMKTAIVSPFLYGNVALVDPSLTYTLPPTLSASTGLDALSHALEAIMSTGSNLITDVLGLQAVNLIFLNIIGAYNGDIKSRYYMSLGSLIAGMAFGNAGVCIGHASAYTFAVSYGVTHGVSCALVLPYIFRHNSSAITDKIPRIAQSFKIDPLKKDVSELTELIYESILNLMDDLKIPTKLSELGLPKENITKLAERLLQNKRLLQRNPKKISREDAINLFKEMW